MKGKMDFLTNPPRAELGVGGQIGRSEQTSGEVTGDEDGVDELLSSCCVCVWNRREEDEESEGGGVVGGKRG